MKESYQLNLSHLLHCKPVLLYQTCTSRSLVIHSSKSLKAIMVTLRCLEFSRVFSLLLFKIKYLFGYSSGQVGKFVSELAIYERCSGLAEFISLPFTFS